MTDTREIPIGLIDPPLKPHRLSIDDAKIDALAASISANGLINAISVATEGDRYRVTAGHRRLIAHQRLCASTVRCTIDETPTATRATATRIAENFDRADLSPIEEALALSRAMSDLTLDLAGLARLVKRRPEWCVKRLDLLALPDDLGPLVHNRTLPMQSAAALARCTDPEHRQYLTTYALNSGANAHVIAEWVDSWATQINNNPNAEPTRPTPAPAGERPIVQLPCWICQQPTDYTKMAFVRLCTGCHASAERAAAAA